MLAFILKMSKNYGFTLVELLVVISIIGILAGVGMVSFSAAQVRARDSQRKADLKTIQQALEMYYTDNQKYPLGKINSGGGGGDWISGLTPNYIKQIPLDPKNSSTAGWPWDGVQTYAYFSVDWPEMCGLIAGTYYVLAAHLEGTSDIGKSVTLKGSCTWGAHYGLYSVTSP